MLTGRETASLLWVRLILAIALPREGARQTIAGVVRSFMARSIIVSALIYAGYVLTAVRVFAELGLWNPSLAKDTVIWSVTVGLPLLWSNTSTAKPGFYRRAAGRTVGVSAFVGFYLNQALFPLPVEFLLQGIVVVIGWVSVTGKYDPKLAPAKRTADRLGVLIGLAVFGYVTWSVGTHVSNLINLDLGPSLLLPIWLTLVVLPFLYPFHLLLNYESALKRMSVSNQYAPIGLKAKMALVLGFRLATRDMDRLAGTTACWQLARTKSIREGLKIVADYRWTLRQAEAEKRRAADRLRDNAALTGTDEEGRQLDEREFAETRDALEWIASCQMGWYRNRGRRYRSDLLELVRDYITSYGLPAEHGIRLVVSKNGKAWYAWRRTITGWCFAIGSAKEPPDQWRYDGPKPPKGLPGKDPTWGAVSPDQTINWPA